MTSLAELRSEYPSESLRVEDQESSGGNVVALVAVVEEEATLIGALDFQAVEASQGYIGSEITVRFQILYVSEGAIFPMKGKSIWLTEGVILPLLVLVLVLVHY